MAKVKSPPLVVSLETEEFYPGKGWLKRTVPMGGITGIICMRGRRSKAPCDVPSCGRTHVALCDYPLTGSKVRTCDMKLCGGHKWPVPGKADTDYCPAHRKLFERGPVQGVLLL